MKDFEEIVGLLVDNFYQYASEPGSEPEFQAGIASNLLHGITGPPMASLAFDRLIENGLVRQTNYSPPTFEITVDLVKEAIRRHQKKASSAPEPNTIPASDHFVTLDHNKPEVRDAIETVEAVIEEARKSNEFAALFADPNERVVFLSEMKAGLGLAKASDVIDTKTIKHLLLSKLEWIKEKLPDWSASALVSKAIESVIKWLLGG